MSAGIAQLQDNGQQPAWGVAPEQDRVGLLHASPPCQSLSTLNRYRCLATVQDNLFPLLNEVRGASRVISAPVRLTCMASIAVLPSCTLCAADLAALRASATLEGLQQGLSGLPSLACSQCCELHFSGG